MKGDPLKEYWIKAEEKFIENFMKEHGREPTIKEIADAMPDWFAAFMGDLVDESESKVRQMDRFAKEEMK